MPDPSQRVIARELRAILDADASVERKAGYLKHMRELSGGSFETVDLVLLEDLEKKRKALLEIREDQQALRGEVDRLTQPPLHVGVFIRASDTGNAALAEVLYGGSRRVVQFMDGMDPALFCPGEEVYLGPELNLITSRSPTGLPGSGETAVFDRILEDGRLVLQRRDEEIIVDPAGRIDGSALESGDKIRFDPQLHMAFEQLEKSAGTEYLIPRVEEVSRDQVGGQDESLERILAQLTTAIVDPDGAAAYGIGGRSTLLLWGPPGTGKTLLARTAASELQRLSGETCHFAVVKPGEWESMWVGETQRKIRSTFARLREAAEAGLALLFLDEIESMARIRGGQGGRHNDQFLATLLAELDGFEGRGRIAVIAATNRRDLLDQALLDRMSDLEVFVGRPDLAGARDIFRIHLPDTVDCRARDCSGTEARAEVIERIVSLFYSRTGEADLCDLRFQNGGERRVAAHELVSGRLIEQICRSVCQRVYLRSRAGGEPAITTADMEQGGWEAIDRLRTTLSPVNVHAYLPDLRHDTVVVGVEPVQARPHREAQDYLVLEVA